MSNQGYSKQSISIDHVTIRSNHSFDVVRAKLEKLVPRIDDGIFILVRNGEGERALQLLQALPPLSIFSFRDHGALLVIAGAPRRAVQYDIGNPLTASKMTRHQIATGLYAPIRVLLREDSNGEVAFEYDSPATTFGQFGNDEVDKVAKQLDKDLLSALEQAAL
jgi:uncharacterized protein (DUF302 family)